LPCHIRTKRTPRSSKRRAMSVWRPYTVPPYIRRTGSGSLLTSILGSEPFAQAEGLLALVKELRRRGCQHILCYSGYTFETLLE